MKELLGAVFSFFESLSLLRAILGFILVFFLPGFAWTLVFWRQINVFERITFSFGLSIMVVTLSLLFLNRAGMRIAGFNSVVVILVITIVPVVGYYLSRLVKRRSGKSV